MRTAMRSRVQRGVHEGGQFRTEARSETAVSLLPPSDMLDAADSADDLDDWSFEDSTGALGGSPEQRSIISVARSGVRNWIRKKEAALPFDTQIEASDVDDLVAETVARAYATNKGSGEPSWKWVTTVAHNVVNDHIRGSLRGEEFKARLLLEQQLVDDLALGRQMTPHQVEQAAALIRDTWADQRHKPSTDFHSRARRAEPVDPLSLVETAGEEEGDAVDEDSPIGRVLTGKVTRAAARASAWEAYTSRMPDVPAAVGLGRADAAAARGEVARAGGTREVAAAVLRGEDSQATRALLAPFVVQGPHDETEVAQVLLDAGAYADDLFIAAASTRAVSRPVRRR